MSKTIGVIGLGSIGLRHAHNLLAMGHRVRDYDVEMKKRLALNGVLWDMDEVLESDAVVIASPTVEHLLHLMQCVDAGKHVFIEKPISYGNAAAVNVALREAAKKKLVVMMGNNLRFHSCVKQAKEWLDDDLIGKPIWANFTCAQYNDKYTDSVILNWGAHEIDLALYLLGPAKVIGSTARINSGRDDDDIADIVLLHSSGARSTIHLDYVTRPEWRGFMISCERGRISTNLVSRQARLYRPDRNSEIDFDGSDGSYDQDYIEEISAFVDRIDGKETLGATGAEGLACLEILLEAQKQAGVS